MDRMLCPYPIHCKGYRSYQNKYFLKILSKYSDQNTPNIFNNTMTYSVLYCCFVPILNVQNTYIVQLFYNRLLSLPIIYLFLFRFLSLFTKSPKLKSQIVQFLRPMLKHFNLINWLLLVDKFVLSRMRC